MWTSCPTSLDSIAGPRTRLRVDDGVVRAHRLTREHETLHLVGRRERILDLHRDTARDHARLALTADAGAALERDLDAALLGRLEHREPVRQLHALARSRELEVAYALRHVVDRLGLAWF